MVMRISKAVDDVIAERVRQIEVEGFDEAHDDEHDKGEISLVAALYATPVRLFQRHDFANEVIHYTDPWPWADAWDKRPYDQNRDRLKYPIPNKKRRDLLVKAGALIIAEIERLDRIKKDD